MFESVKSIRFKGASFDAETTLNLFPKVKDRTCLIFGRNGTGKTTIARAFRKIAGNEQTTLQSSSLLSESGALALTEEHQKSIHVFDEEYINDNIRIKEDGLESIVILGKLVDIEKKIEVAEEEYKKAKEKREKQAEECKKYSDNNSLLAPSYYHLKINIALSGDDKWAGCEKNILGNRINARVNDAVIKDILEKNPTKSEQEIRAAFEENMAVLNNINSGAEPITKEIKPVMLQLDTTYVFAMLKKIIDSTVLFLY